MASRTSPDELDRPAPRRRPFWTTPSGIASTYAAAAAVWIAASETLVGNAGSRVGGNESYEALDWLAFVGASGLLLRRLLVGRDRAVERFERAARASRETAERALAERAAVLEAASIGIAVVRRGRVALANPALVELAAEPADAPFERRALDFAHPDDRARLRAEAGAAFASATTFVTETRVRAKGDTFRWARIAGRALDAESSVWVVEDVDDQRLEHDRTRAVLDRLPIACVVTDAEFAVLHWNAAAERTLGWRADEIVGKNAFATFVPSAAAERARGAFERLARGEAEVLTTGTTTTREGRAVRCEWSGTLLRDAEGRATGMVAIAEELGAKRARRDRIRLAEHIFEDSPNGIVITDTTGSIVGVNAAFERITGFARDEVLGKNPRLLQSGAHSPDFYAAMWRELVERGNWSGEIDNRRKSGEIYPERLAIHALRDADGTPTHYVGTFTDVTDAKRREAAVERLAHFDALTGLPNRPLFADRSKIALAHAARAERHVALLFLDLDRFKLVNDSLGHAAGDSLLRSVAARLGRAVRESDTVARHGGDEFLVLVPDLALPDDAARVAKQLLETFEEPFELDGRTVAIGASIGIASAPHDGADVDALLHAADAAMYQAKEQGRGGYRFYSPDMHDRALEQLELEADLHRAVGAHEIGLAFQPQHDLVTGRLVGFEALARWTHAKRGAVSPARFIPVAESTGLILPLGRQLLFAACARARDLADSARFEGMTMAVNVSALQFRQPDFLEMVQRTLDETGLAASALELEITESLAMHGELPLVATLRALKLMGVRLSIDDFGTGYSSLSALRRFPVDKLKIDASFVRGLPDDASSHAVAAIVVNLGHTLGLRVIAEGVETIEQAACLRELGCDESQGYLHARPLAPGAVDAYVVESLAATR